MKKRFFLTLCLTAFSAATLTAQTAKKTITNADLEKFRVARETAEADYRANYQKLGMPSPEELEQRQNAERQKLEESSAKSRQDRAARQTELNEFYQQEARLLKTQYTDVNAKIAYMQNLISQYPNQNSVSITTSDISIIGVVPYGVGGGYYGGDRRGGYLGGRGDYNRRTITNQTVVGPNTQTVRNAAAGAPNPYAGTALQNTGVKVVIGNNYPYYRNNYPYHGRYRRPIYGGNYFPYVVNNNNNYAKSELITNLQLLEQTRAGIIAQWNLLVEDARRDGIRID